LQTSKQIQLTEILGVATHTATEFTRSTSMLALGALVQLDIDGFLAAPPSEPSEAVATRQVDGCGAAGLEP